MTSYLSGQGWGLFYFIGKYSVMFLLTKDFYESKYMPKHLAGYCHLNS